jgi:DDE superfamily endonuclease
MNKANGAVVRDKGKGGIDWWRYQTVILKPKLIPFALKCMKDRPNTVVQEDKAPAHASQYQEPVFIDAGIIRLFWCSNSPDLNMIEPCWPYMKRQTTRRGAPVNAKEAEKS